MEKVVTKEVSYPLIEQFQKVLVQLPHATKVMVPKLEIDILNADKSNASEHNSLHFIVGGSIKFSVFLSSLLKYSHPSLMCSRRSLRLVISMLT